MKQIFDLQYFAEDLSTDTAIPTGESTAQDAAEQTTGVPAEESVEVQDAAEQTTGESENSSQDAADNEPQDNSSGNVDFVEQISSLSPKEKTELFEKLLQSDKDIGKLTEKRFRQALNKRTAELKAEAERYSRFVSELSAIYGTDDLEQLRNALLFDDEQLEALAYKQGLTKEQLKAQRELELQKKSLELQQQQAQEELNLKQMVESWRQAAEGLSDRYEGFDFDTELTDEDTGEQFFNLLSSGLSPEDAYKIIHINDIVEKAVSAAKEQAKKETIDTVRARGIRPPENANTSQAPAKMEIDVNSLTPEQMDEINRRVMRGEKIVF